MPNICKCDIKKKKCNGIRKMSEKEKKLVKEHFSDNHHNSSERMKMINAICRSKELKNMNDLKKLHNKLFVKSSSY